MDTTRSKNVRLDVLDRTSRYAVGLSAVVILSIFGLIGMYGPTMLEEIHPSNGLGEGIDLWSSQEQKHPPNHCYYDEKHELLDDPIKHCWRHEFFFVNPYSNYFSLSMTTHRSEPFAKFDSISKSLELELELYGLVTHDDNNPVLIAQDSVTRTIVCNTAGAPCQATVLFTASHIVFDRYRFMVRVPEQSLDSYSFINGTDIVFAFEGYDYALLELVIKYLLQAATLFLVYPYWWYNCNKYKAPISDASLPLTRFQRMFPFVSAEEKWVTALLIGSVAFCNPLAFLDYNASPGVRRVGEVLAVMAQFSYVCLLLSFWLVSFDSLTTEDASYRRSKRFWFPKAVFCGVFWLIGVCLYGWITVNSIDFPLYNWYEDELHFYLIKVYLYSMGIVYVFWMFGLVVRGAGEFFGMSNASAFAYTQHIIPLVATLIGLMRGHIFDIDVHEGTSLVFYHALFVLYPWQLAFLYTPFPATDEHRSIMMRPIGDDARELGARGTEHAVLPHPSNKPHQPEGSTRAASYTSRDAEAAGLSSASENNIIDVTLA